MRNKKNIKQLTTLLQGIKKLCNILIISIVFVVSRGIKKCLLHSYYSLLHFVFLERLLQGTVLIVRQLSAKIM